jgi:murein DD-endopeptidase MepM/ murein hydrolase activator NlpD
VGTAKQRVRRQRQQTKRFRALAAAETRTIALRAGQVRALRDELLASENRLASARASKRESLRNVKESKQEFLSEAAGLARASASLAAQIAAVQSALPTRRRRRDAVGQGFIWPVHSPVTSGFGALGPHARRHRHRRRLRHADPRRRLRPRHLRGLDGGYGNLVAIDHGRGISTAYGHQSSIAVSNGETVSQGQVIGYVGCTGHCFGPHLHFEVRINGAPVDPLGYL